ncbi:hypothetical protein Shyd_18290 [Streptomyces hydrogenans]|uniref:Uncharacterized protein n=1 Tax=Streptomyces hydrogenans TaxID=1873719 RepID=A0ABQ3P609_9ACTN|nr:hypothetical protein Shyd_18290 [Streptomyces hydrogenans]
MHLDFQRYAGALRERLSSDVEEGKWEEVTSPTPTGRQGQQILNLTGGRMWAGSSTTSPSCAAGGSSSVSTTSNPRPGSCDLRADPVPSRCCTDDYILNRAARGLRARTGGQDIVIHDGPTGDKALCANFPGAGTRP